MSRRPCCRGRNDRPATVGRRCRVHSRRGSLQRMRYAQFREEAARRPARVADGGHRHLPRTRDALHRGRHRRDGNRHLGDDTQPSMTARPSGTTHARTGLLTGFSLSVNQQSAVTRKNHGWKHVHDPSAAARQCTPAAVPDHFPPVNACPSADAG